MKNNQLSDDLPPELRGQFEVLEKRLWLVDTMLAIGGTVCGLILSYALLFVSDRFWDTSPAVRLLLTVSGLAVGIYLGLFWLKNWVFNRRDTRKLSTIVQRHFPRLGDRLLGIVELSEQNKGRGEVSEGMRLASIEQVSKEAIRFDFRAVVAMRKANLCVMGAAMLLLIGLTPLLFVPEAGLNAFLRWLPGSKAERFTFVSLEKMPSEFVVPHGESFEISCGVGLHNFWKPRQATCQFEAQSPIRVPVAGNKVVFKIPGQIKLGDIRLRVGDVTRNIAVKPLHRPALTGQSAKVRFPDYLKYPESVEEVRTATFSYLEGSYVSFKAQASRDIKQATVTTTTISPEQTVSEPAAALNKTALETRPLDLDKMAAVSLNWKDIYGLDGAAPWKLSFQSHKDQAPRTDCPEQPPVVAILEHEVVRIKTIAEDDFGLLELGVTWEATKRNSTNVFKTGSLKLSDGAPQTKNLASTYSFSPTILGLPIDTVVDLKATAKDYRPGRQATSASYKIYILSAEEHALLVQQQLEKTMSELEAVIRREENLIDSAKESQKPTSDPANKEKSKEEAQNLNRQANEQNSLADKLKEMSRQIAELSKEALRNPEIKPEALAEMAKAMQKMQALANKQMAKATKSLGKASQSPSQEQRNEEIEEALKNEEEALAEMKEMQKKAQQNMERMQANTIVARLKRIAGFEREIGTNMMNAFPELVGATLETLNRKLREQMVDNSNGQMKTSKDANSLQEEVGRFFERTTVADFGVVAKEMKESEVSAALEKNSELIRQNIAMKAIQGTQVFSKQFDRWAEMLDKKKDDGGEGGGGGGGGGGESEAMKRLLALMKMRQAQDDLRKQTTAAEQQRAALDPQPIPAPAPKPAPQPLPQPPKCDEEVESDSSCETNDKKELPKPEVKKEEVKPAVKAEIKPEVKAEVVKKHSVESEKLSERQFNLMRDLLLERERGPSEYLGDAQKAMGEAKDLLDKSNTGLKTIETESDVINLLDAELAAMIQPGKGKASPEEMEMMMQMMEMMGMMPGQGQGKKPGEGQGQSPGMSSSGGNTDKVNKPVPGAASGADGPNRKTSKGSGTSRPLPSEFKDALQGYFKAVEESRKNK